MNASAIICGQMKMKGGRMEITPKEFSIIKGIAQKLENEIFEYLKNINLSSQYDLHITITKEKIEFVGINKKEK